MAARDEFVTVPVATLEGACDRLWKARGRLSAASEFIDGLKVALELAGSDVAIRMGDLLSDVDHPMDDVELAVADLEIYAPNPRDGRGDRDD